MAQFYVLTDAQSNLVQELEEGVNRFDETSIFDSEAISMNREEVLDIFEKLKKEWPEVASEARDFYYDAEVAEDPEEAAGYWNPLFDTLLECHAFANSTTVNSVSRSIRRMSEHLSDLKSYSKAKIEHMLSI